MPTIAIIDGIRIVMYINDHPPPHFHAVEGEYRAVFSIASGQMVRGQFPRRSARKVEQWTDTHHEALMAAWNALQNGQIPSKIK